jgi:hypothetical protein
MPTVKQIAANQLNSQKATGPRSTRGKAVSRFNSLKHGFFDALIANEWRLRRISRIEANLWETANLSFQVNNLVKDIEVPDPCSSGDDFATDSSFERLQHFVNSCARNDHRALTELQVARSPGRRTPQPQHSKTTSAKLASLRKNPTAAPPATAIEVLAIL